MNAKDEKIASEMSGNTLVSSLSLLTLILALGAVSLWMLAPFLLPVAMGGVIASVLRPVYEALLRGGIGRRLGAAAFVGVATGLVDNFVRPLVLGRQRGLHPFVSLLAILAGLKIFGILGIFLGPVIIAVLIVLLDAWPEALGRLVRRTPVQRAAAR